MGTLNSVPKRLVAVVFSCVVLANCGSCGGDDDPPSTGGGVAVVTVPSVPLNLSANVGTTALSLGWDVPANNGGSSSLTYDVDVTVTPAALTPPVVTVTGTRALITNVDLVRTYTVAVRARNSSGVSAPTTSLMLHPQSVINTSYQPVAVIGNPSPVSGIFDPSVMPAANGDVWMSYSNVEYYLNPSSQLVQDVGIRIARSTNGGATFNYATTVVAPSVGTVTDTDPALSACGTATCTGRWVYETSWLIDDPTDTNAARRYKLFAHRYFLMPGRVPSATLYHLGAIVMWTASAPGGPWSGETSLLGWNLTPPQLTPLRNFNSINAAELGPCLLAAEGSASVRNGTIDFAFACPYVSGAQIPQKIVLLRSADHANTFQYVSTPLTVADAAPFTATHFSAPALLANPGTAPVLIATQVSSVTGAYAGCAVFPIANDATGELFRANSLAVSILSVPSGGLLGGACTYDRNLGARGILVNGVVLPTGSPPVNAQFTIQATQAALQQP